jgi:hypothetical protein
MRQRLAALETHPPYHFFDLGMAATRPRRLAHRPRDVRARGGARRRQPRVPLTGSASPTGASGEESAALRHLTLAKDNSLTRDQHDLYAAKLAWLQAHRQQ